MNRGAGRGEEAETLERAKAGDRGAFEAALRPHLPMLLAYSRTICGDYHTAQDVVQETSLIAFRGLSHLYAEADFRSWLRAIARRQALSARRKLGRHAVGAAELLLEIACEVQPPDGVAPQQQALRECLGRLGGRIGEAVRAYYLRGSKVAEIARALSTSENAVKQLLFRGRQALRDCVGERLERLG